MVAAEVLLRQSFRTIRTCPAQSNHSHIMRQSLLIHKEEQGYGRAAAQAAHSYQSSFLHTGRHFCIGRGIQQGLQAAQQGLCAHGVIMGGAAIHKSAVRYWSLCCGC